jgi:hypothetical protein
MLAHDALRDGWIGVAELFGQVHIKMNVPKQRQPTVPLWRTAVTVSITAIGTSGEKRFDFLLMAPSSKSVEPPQNSGRFTMAHLLGNPAFILHFSKQR